MKRIILISFLFISFLAKAQQYTNFQGYGFKANRLWADSVSIQPSDTVKNKVAKSIAILNNKLYVADGTKWIIAGGGAVDTFLLSTRAWRQKGIDSVSANVNFRVKYTDTALMLLPYLRKADTISLSNRIDARVKYTDTATMLSPYLRTANATTGTVTSIATNYGLLGGTITTSGTLSADTSKLSTKAWRQKGIDSVQNNLTLGLANKLNISDTASMLSPYSKLKSVGLTMPSAFNVANSPLTSDGTLAVSGAGTASQYVRGDGQLATFPSTSSGGSSVNYYLNGSVNASVAGYKQLDNAAIVGTGTDFTLTGNGLIAQFLTDAGNPNRIQIPGGAWNFEMFFQVSSAGGNQKFYVELLKYNGTTFTSIASSITAPEEITGGTSIDLYLTSLAVPTTTLLTTDRLAIRVYIVDNAVGRTVTLHTENNTLCEIITTFAGGVSALNGLTANTQYFATGTSGTDFNILSLTDTHTFNLPIASATNTGKLSSANWTTFNNKQNALTLTTTGTSGAATLTGATLNIPQYQAVLTNPITGTGTGTSLGGTVAYFTGTTTQAGNTNLWWDNTNARLGILNNAPNSAFQIGSNIAGTAQTKLISVNDATTTDYSNAAFFNSNIATTRLGFVLSNSSSTNWANNHLAILVTGASHPNNNYFTNISGKGNDAGYGMIMGQGSQTTGLLIGTYGTTPVYLGTNNNARMSIFSNGNTAIGTTTDAGYKLDVNGTARFQDALTVSKNQNSSTILTVSNTTAGTGSQANLTLQSDATAGNGQMFKYSSLRPGYKTINSSDLGFYNSTGGNISILNDVAAGNITFAAGGSSTAHLRIFSNGNVGINQNTDAGYKLDVNGTARVQTSAYFATSSGSVGIGTTAPEVKLDVKGTSTGTLTGMALFRDASTNGNGLLVRAGTGRVDLLATWISSGINTDLTFTPTTSGGVQNEVMRVTSAGNVGIGTTTPNASSLLDISSTTKGFLPPRMTTAERDLIATPAAGLVIFNTTLNQLSYYNGTSWINL